MFTRILLWTITVVSLLSMAIAFSLTGWRFISRDDDPRASFGGFSIFAHPDFRVAMRFGSGPTWSFDYTWFFLANVACFVVVTMWHVVRSRPRGRRSGRR